MIVSLQQHPYLKHCSHSSLVGFVDTELQLVVAAPCDVFNVFPVPEQFIYHS